MRVLITGGTGLLAKSLIETVPPGVEWAATCHQRPAPAIWSRHFHPLEIRDEKAVGELVRSLKPDVIVHAASVGSVDEAERDPEGVRQVNVGGTRALLRSARASGAFLIHISSNAVFDGRQPPYGEKAPTRAVNRYGQIKIEAEGCVRASGLPHLIVRPILMYGWPLPGGRGNVVTRWLTALSKGQQVQVDQEIVSMPLYAVSGAEVIWKAALGRFSGIVHVAGRDRLALFDFARQVARAFDYPESLIRAVPGSALDVSTPRPRDTSFDTTRMEREFGVFPLGCEEGLARMRRAAAP